MTLALAARSTFEEASAFANLAAGVVVAKVGTATASPEEILHAAQ
jgi:bifunctional ADP-heptose synthase (sugar kinase/adenylyltransferase)